MRWLLEKLQEPRLRGINVDDVDLVYKHREILRMKPIMLGVMEEFYSTCRGLDDSYLSGSGLRIEIGGGSSIFKDFFPDVIVTDIKPATYVDRTLNAQKMDLAHNSVRAFYGINCFHHFPEPDRFFSELNRVLVPGGGCILIEPYYGPSARFMYKRLFKSETFDPQQKDWSGEVGQGAMTNANQALSYIVFRRDRVLFDQRHPELEIVYQQRIRNYIRYVLSGGLNFRKLVPDSTVPLLKALECLLAPIDHLFALHHVIVLRKRL
jgi:SAM-dependent methyltransferase